LKRERKKWGLTFFCKRLFFVFLLIYAFCSECCLMPRALTCFYFYEFA
jgi:hypothetical protein